MTVTGVNVVDGFINYLLGFQTGYNYAAPGTYDVFSNLGSNFDEANALYWIEAWCKDHPSSNFGEGVVAFAEKVKSR